MTRKWARTARGDKWHLMPLPIGKGSDRFAMCGYPVDSPGLPATETEYVQPEHHTCRKCGGICLKIQAVAATSEASKGDPES